MPKRSRPRRGSLQFWPRKRAAKVLPSVNWKPVSSTNQGKNQILGFITYKVGMATAVVKDNTEHSMTKGKRKSIPVTILEAPNMKIFSVRFYNKGKVIKDLIVSNDKELKKRLKLPKSTKNLDKDAPTPESYDDIKIITYSIPKQTSIKKTPDMTEIALGSDTKESKLELVKTFLTKEITIADFTSDFKLVDTRGLTKGQGFTGPVKRFGITLKRAKSEKGVRRPGSLAPWHPARVTFHAPQAGQLGNFARVTYNLNLINSNSISEKDINPKQGFKNYGRIKTSYVIVKGSVQGSAKRQIIITPSYRPTKLQEKQDYELVEVLA